MLHKLVIDTLSAQASRLLMNEGGLPGPEVEKHLKVLLQSALSKLDVVSRDEFDTQQAVLMLQEWRSGRNAAGGNPIATVAKACRDFYCF